MSAWSFPSGGQSDDPAIVLLVVGALFVLVVAEAQRQVGLGRPRLLLLGSAERAEAVGLLASLIRGG